MTYTVSVRTDPSRHVQDPVRVPWIVVSQHATKAAADLAARDLRAEGETVRVSL